MQQYSYFLTLHHTITSAQFYISKRICSPHPKWKVIDSVHEWGWEPTDSCSTSWVIVDEDKKLVTFHSFSTGTAAAEGDTPLHHSYHYYWEVKILTEIYGTDIHSK